MIQDVYVTGKPIIVKQERLMEGETEVIQENVSLTSLGMLCGLFLITFIYKIWENHEL